MNFRKWFYEIGEQYRNPSLQKIYKELKKSETYSKDQLFEIQFEKLKKIVFFALDHSLFYKDYWKDWEEELRNNFSISLYENLPIVSKEQLIQFNESIHTDKAFFKKRFFCETSGTSGQVLTFLRDEYWDSFNRASILRGYSWHGVYPWEYNLYFWGYNTNFNKRLKTRFFDFLVNRYRIFDYDEKSLGKVVEKIQHASYIEGYSSMIYELACIAEHEKLNVKKLKMVKGTSEKIYDHYQEKVNQVFGKNMISEYGAAESGIIAFECEKGNMHANLEGVYIETDSENEINML